MTRRCWFLIPTRGGSRGLPRKNMLSLAGAPLFLHVVKTLTKAWDPQSVVLMTDDDEIAGVGRSHGIRIIREPRTTGMATLDDVALAACDQLTQWGAKPDDILVTVQPTSPFLRAETVMACLAQFAAGARTVLTVRDDRHLRWGRDAAGYPVPTYPARVNRQQQKPLYRETGGVIACSIGDLQKTHTRIQQGHVAIVEVDEREALDIDYYTDFLVAEHFATRRKALIRADGARELGIGHINRALALASQLAAYGVQIATRADGDYRLGHELLQRHPFPVIGVRSEEEFFQAADDYRPDVIFLDILNTDRATIERLRATAGKIVTFEDLGEGSQSADLVINDLYVSHIASTHILSGVENAILSGVFDHVTPMRSRRARVENLLVIFGGTDPSNLTEKALSAAAASEFDGKVTLVLGPGRCDRPVALDDYGLKGEVLQDISNIAEVMANADMAISSAGRTVTELMTLGVPTLVLCQNERELLHTHASMPYGVMNLGLGSLIGVDSLAATLGFLIANQDLRGSMNGLMRRATEHRNNRRIVKRIEKILGFD